MQVCKRCAGQVLSNYGELSCLQCGYSVEVNKPVFIHTNDARISMRENLSIKPSQLKRRMKRLLLRGIPEDEAQRIINLQIGAQKAPSPY